MMERPTTITAGEWHKVADAVKAGRCEVSREEDFSTLIKEITASYAGGYLRTAWYPDPKSEVSIIGADDVLYVRWLDTAQTERDAEAYAEFEAGFQAASKPEAGIHAAYKIYLDNCKEDRITDPFTFEQYAKAYDIMQEGRVDFYKQQLASLQAERDTLQAELERYKALHPKMVAERRDMQNTNATLRAQLAAGVQVVEVVTDSGIKQRGVWHTIDNTERLFIDVADVSALVKERDALARKLAAAGESITEARKYIAQLFDSEQRFDTSKQGRFVTETLNFADSALMDAQDVVKGTATPQPAPAVNSELGAAVKPVYGANYKPSGEWLHFDPKDDE